MTNRLLFLVVLSLGWIHEGLTQTGEKSSFTPLAPTVLESLKKLREVLSKGDYPNVSFDFRLVEKTKEGEETRFSASYWSSGTATWEGKASSLIRVDYNPEVKTWENGAEPFLETYSSFSYNGKQWTTLERSMGMIGRPFETNVARISAEPPQGFKSPRAGTGEMFFAPHARFGHLPLSQFIEYYIDMISKFFKTPQKAEELFSKFLSIEIEDKSGLIRISLAMPSRETATQFSEMWIDPRRGGALVRSSRVSKSSKGQWIICEDVVTEFKRVGNTWFPAKGIRTDKRPDRETQLHFSGENFKILPAREGLYDISFKPGTEVTDTRTNTTYVVDFVY